MNDLINALKRDEFGQGDLNEWPRDVIVQALRAKLIAVAACSRPFKNIQLTAKGRKYNDDNFRNSR